MENKIVVFANQKGGVGKSTLCILFANYLAWKKPHPHSRPHPYRPTAPPCVHQ